MKKFMGAAMLAGATIAGVGAANAEVSGSVALTTDYVFRGVTQTDNGPAIQGSFDWSNENVYAGAWASNVDDFGADASMELDLYVGITGEHEQFSWDASLVGYFYPGAEDSGSEFDYFEGILAGSYALSEQVSVGATAAYTPEYFGEVGDGLWLAVNGSYAFSDAFSVSGEFGNQDVDTLGDYDTWNLGGSYAMHGFTLDLRYHDTNIDGLDDVVNLTISREL